ncbi:hypothetical protein WMY93_008164 [Mugilogobius chulae]|uniref:Uncharacterized protein n=1 Tax=Mugilogobius chulae TaxID=88201 RepID=A0AAW0PLM2_9GOBI
MEEEAFTDINGRAITLDCQDHSSFCREYVVSSPKVSFWKVMGYTSAVWLVAYTVFSSHKHGRPEHCHPGHSAGMMLHIHFVKVDHESLLVIGSLGIHLQLRIGPRNFLLHRDEQD